MNVRIIEQMAAEAKALGRCVPQPTPTDVKLALWQEYKRRGGDDNGVTVSTVAAEMAALEGGRLTP